MERPQPTVEVAKESAKEKIEAKPKKKRIVFEEDDDFEEEPF